MHLAAAARGACACSLCCRGRGCVVPPSAARFYCGGAASRAAADAGGCSGATPAAFATTVAAAIVRADVWLAAYAKGTGVGVPYEGRICATLHGLGAFSPPHPWDACRRGGREAGCTARMHASGGLGWKDRANLVHAVEQVPAHCTLRMEREPAWLGVPSLRPGMRSACKSMCESGACPWEHARVVGVGEGGFG